MSSNKGSNEKSKVFSGNILFFHAFDIGEDIDLAEIKRRSFLPIRPYVLSSYFKNYHIPLSFQIPGEGYETASEDSDCISSKVHHFGVISFCYKVQFEATFDDLEKKLETLDEEYRLKSELDAKRVYEKILRTIRAPHFYHLKTSYVIIQVDPHEAKLAPEELISNYGETIAKLLRFEVKNLSSYQKEDILESRTGYYGEDIVIIDSQASFVYDAEYFETLEFFETANIQKLELQYFDRVLFDKLNYFYNQGSYQMIPLRAYIPLVGRWLDLPVSQLAKLRVDISVITERLENSISMAGEPFYSNLYAILVRRLSIPEWKDSINKKLDIIHDLYTVYQDHLDAVHEEVLTFVIIILIALEAFGTIMK